MELKRPKLAFCSGAVPVGFIGNTNNIEMERPEASYGIKVTVSKNKHGNN